MTPQPYQDDNSINGVISEVGYSDLDYDLLDRLLDQTKTKVFLGKNASFIGSLMCSLNFTWSADIQTAATNGISIMWNPYWFLSLTPEERVFIIMHELWHVALLHMARRDDRDPMVWNCACDYYINNMLQKEGYSTGTMKGLLNHDYDDKSSEEIYEILINQPKSGITIYLWGHQNINGKGDTRDLIEPEEGEHDLFPQIIGKVVQASHTANLISSAAGQVPGNVQQILKRFLQPKLPWAQLFYAWMSDLHEQDYTFKRPNRRYSDMYLPSLEDDEGRLEHLCYYLDVSGSVSDKDVIRYNSEVKFIWDEFQPKKLTIILFDWTIKEEIVFLEGTEFDEILITGRGGTSFHEVREHIIKHKPTAAIVFSDMDCAPMEKLPSDIETNILWVGINASKNTEINMGKIIYLRE